MKTNRLTSFVYLILCILTASLATIVYLHITHSTPYLFYLSLATSLIAGFVLAICTLRIQKNNAHQSLLTQEAQKQEARYRKMIDDSGVVIFTTNLTGYFVFVSSKAKSLTGYDTYELSGQHYTFLVEDAWQATLTSLYRQQLAEGIAETFIEFPIITKDIETKWVEQSAVLLKENGEITGFQCVVKDITERKKAEEDLKSSDQKIRAMLSSTSEGIYILDEQLNFILLNDVAKRVLWEISGKEQYIGMDATGFLPTQYTTLAKRVYQLALKGRSQEMEMRLDTLQGEKWYHTMCFPVKAENGEIIGICASLKDVTERVNTEKALEKTRKEKEESQYRLQAILDNTPLMVFVKDLEGRYMFVNRRFKEFFQLSDEQVIGKVDFDFDTPLNAGKFRELDQQVIETRQHIESEETIWGENHFKILHIFKCPLFDKNGAIYGVGGIATDVTEKTEYQEKLIAAKLKAEAAEQLQEQFLANMSHEIRTPMNGIIGMANILQETPLNTEQQEFVHIIRQSSDKLLMLINDILDLSKIKAGKLVLEKTDFALQQEVESVMAPFRIKAQEKGLRLTLLYDLPSTLTVSADRLRLHQVLTNLISNAVKFTSEGSVVVEVSSTRLTSKEITLQFTVSDTGVGIPAEKQARVFESFVQADSGITRKFGGTGLGLSITRQLIEIQGGEIDVTSEAGMGTRFFFTLTYELSQQLEAPSSTQVTSVQDRTELVGKRILVVEDNDVNQKVILTYLKKAGLVTEIANNGKEAIELLENGHRYDLAIMDLQMPEMNGFQTAAYIRQKLELTMPIIAMTASALRNEKMKCYELGMNEYLTKPFVPSELFKHLRRFLLKKTTAAIAEPALANQTDLYHLSYLYEMEDPQYFCEVLELFLTTTPLLLEEIKTETIYENWDGVYQKAHKLKSSVSLLQMNELLEIVTRVEQHARDRKAVEDIANDVHLMIEKFQLIQPLIEAELKEGQARLLQTITNENE